MLKSELIKKASRVHATFYKSWNKDKIQERIGSALECKLETVQGCIEHHEKHARAYFWVSPSNASARRSEERRKSFTKHAFYDGDDYTFVSTVSCSCKNYYYTGEFFVNGEKKDLRLFKSLLKRLAGEMG